MPYLQIYINCLRKLLTPLYTPSTEHTRTAALASPPKAVLPALPQEAAHDPRKQPRLTMPAVSTPSAMVLQASTPLVQQPPLAAQTSTHPISNKHLESQSTPTSSTPAPLPQAAPPAPTQLTTSKNHVGNGSRSKTKSPTGAQSDGNNLTMKANIQTRPASISQRHNNTRIQHPTGHQGELRSTLLVPKPAAPAASLHLNSGTSTKGKGTTSTAQRKGVTATASVFNPDLIAPISYLWAQWLSFSYEVCKWLGYGDLFQFYCLF